MTLVKRGRKVWWCYCWRAIRIKGGKERNVEQILINQLAISLQCQHPFSKPCLLLVKRYTSKAFNFFLTFISYCIIFCNTVTVFLLKVGEVKTEISQLGAELVNIYLTPLAHKNIPPLFFSLLSRHHLDNSSQEPSLGISLN